MMDKHRLDQHLKRKHLLDRFCRVLGFSIREDLMSGSKSKVCMLCGKDKRRRLDLACVFRRHDASARRWQWTVEDREDKKTGVDATILENGIFWCDELCFKTSIKENERTIDLSCVNNIEALEIWLDLQDEKPKD